MKISTIPIGKQPATSAVSKKPREPLAKVFFGHALDAIKEVKGSKPNLLATHFIDITV